MSEIFNSFKEASSFAKSKSIELGVLHKIIKIDNKWTVLSKDEKFIKKEPTKEEIDLRKKVQALEERIEAFESAQRREEERAKREREEKKIKAEQRREEEKLKAEQRREEEKLKAEQERKDYLQRQKETYLSFSSEKLTELSLSYLADDLSLEDDEFEILLPILRPYLESLREEAEKDRLDFLNERKEYYLSLQEDVLDKLWLESDGLSESEKEMLKRALRYKKGWTKVP